MNVHLRKAMLSDVPRLWQLRRDSIIELAPEGMAIAQAEAWAAALTVAGMERRFLETEIWVGETDGIIAGWIAMREDYIDGLYTDPRYARQNVATQLLCLAERLMSERAIQIIRLEASLNAEHFYLRRGYLPTTVRVPNEAIPMEKRLSPPKDSNCTSTRQPMNGGFRK
jgi:ribosomal protein S18 acetylase RimI-like enzyme